jgi:excisionase family DNA binding protein
VCTNQRDYEGMTKHTDAQLTPILVSKKTAATMLSLCVRTIDHLIATKQLPSRRVGKRVLVPHAALVAFARRDHISARGCAATIV